jgi:hypothetical protein
MDLARKNEKQNPRPLFIISNIITQGFLGGGNFAGINGPYRQVARNLKSQAERLKTLTSKKNFDGEIAQLAESMIQEFTRFNRMSFRPISTYNIVISAFTAICILYYIRSENTKMKKIMIPLNIFFFIWGFCFQLIA